MVPVARSVMWHPRFVEHGDTAIAKPAPASLRSNTGHCEAVGATGRVTVTMVGGRSNRPVDNLRQARRHYRLHHTGRMILHKLASAHPAELPYYVRHMVAALSATHHTRAEVDNLLNACELSGIT